MKIFLDTANVVQIREAARWGVLDGVTTNPTLVAKEKRPFHEVVREICGIVAGPRERGNGFPGRRSDCRRGAPPCENSRPGRGQGAGHEGGTRRDPRPGG